MTDKEIREFFWLDDDADIDVPIANLEFRSYREAAVAYFAQWSN